MMGWRGLASGVLVFLPALLLSVSLAETWNPGGPYPIIAQAETGTSGEQAPEAQAEASEQTEESAGSTGGEDPAHQGEAVAFTDEFLNDPAHQAGGKELWESTCQHCHGSKAYPGKAPKLRPGKYTPDFVYDRVTNGFRKMPAWKDIFTDEERMNVVAYVLSDRFSP